MDAAYFHERWCVTLAQFGRHILKTIGTYPPSVLEELDVLEFGGAASISQSTSLVSATHELVEEFMDDFIAHIVLECLENPKTKRRRDPPPIDVSNTRIQAGYAADTFVVCGGLGFNG